MTFYNNNDFSQSKIEGKFYALKNEDHLRACRELTPAQRDIFYHLKSLDPYGDRFLNITIIGIARLLKLSRATVSRALKALDNLGWLELELIYVRVAVRMREGNKSYKDEQKCLGSDITDTLCDISDTVPTLEPLSDIGSKPPKTIKTLSLRQKREREIFRIWNEKG